MSSLETRMRQANPIPDARAEFGDDEIAALLTLTRARSTDMDVKEMTTPVTPDENRRRGLLIAVAAAAVVVLVVGAVLLLGGGTDDVAPATSPSTTLDASPTTTGPVDQDREAAADEESPTTTAFVAPELDAEAAAVIEDIFEDLNAGDIDAAVARMFEADEVISTAQGFEIDQRDAVAGRWAYGVEIESTFEVLGCTTTTAGLTRCEIARTSPFDFSSLDPVLSVIQARLVDGRVSYMRVEPIPGAWNATEDAFLDWVEGTHPDALKSLYFDFSDPAQSAELMRQYYPEWLESRSP